MADSFSPWVKPNNQLKAPKGVNSGWGGVMSPQAQMRNFGSFAGDDTPAAPTPAPIPSEVPGQYQGLGQTINGRPPIKVDISGAHFFGPPKTAAAPPKPRQPAAPQYVPRAPIASAQPSMPAQMPADDGSYTVPDDSTYQTLLANLDESQISGIADQKRGLGDEEARIQQLHDQVPGVDLSALFAYQKATQGMDLGEGYKRPQNRAELDKQADDLQQLLHKNRQGLTDDQIKILDSGLNAEGRRLGIDEQAMQRGETARAVAALNAQSTQDRLAVTKRGQDLTAAGRAATNARVGGGKAGNAYQKLITDYNPNKASSRSDLGRNQAVITNAGRLEALGAQGAAQPGGLTSSQIEELATATASMLSGGTVGAQGSIRRLVPKTISGDKASIESYIKGIPVGAGQQAFVNQLLETARRERETSQNFINAAQANAYRDAKPLLTPDQAAEYAKNHPHVVAPEGGTTGTGSAPSLIDMLKAEKAKRAAGGQK